MLSEATRVSRLGAEGLPKLRGLARVDLTIPVQR